MPNDFSRIATALRSTNSSQASLKESAHPSSCHLQPRKPVGDSQAEGHAEALEGLEGVRQPHAGAAQVLQRPRGQCHHQWKDASVDLQALSSASEPNLYLPQQHVSACTGACTSARGSRAACSA